MNNDVFPRENWSASVTDHQQPNVPVLTGVAVGLGALLWLGPFMGINSVLNPAKLSNIIGQNAEVNNFLALLGTLGAVTSTITTIIIGALSDLTRSRRGRRTPWIVTGSVLTAAVMTGLGMINSREQLGLFILLWCLLQTFINFVVAPLLAVIADRVAPRHRGLISSVYAAGFIIGQYGGPVAGGLFLSDANPELINAGYYAMACAMLLSGPLAAFIIKEKSSLDMPVREMNKKLFIQYFIFPVRAARDFYLALFGKMLVAITLTAFSVYQLFFLTSGMGLTSSSAGHYISLMGVATMVTALIFAPLSGPVSDKLRTRKKPVFLSALLIAAGTLIPFFWPQPEAMIWYGVIAGIGSGIFFSVDQALNLEVLPSHENSAKDLGILNFANTGAQILGPVLGALLYGVMGNQYLPILPVLAIIALGGGVLVMMIRKVN